MTAEALYVVHVLDRVDMRLAGHDSRAYASPPQPHDDALALIAMLLGSPCRAATGNAHWTRPIAGGQRVITLAAAAAVV